MNNISNLIKIGKKASEKGFTPGISGNISIKDNKILYITKTGSKLSNLSKEDLVFLNNDLDSFHLKKRGSGPSPSIETGLHIKTYNKTNSNAILHTHPLFTRLISKDTDKLSINQEERKSIEIKEVPIINNYEAGSNKLAKKGSEKLKQNKAIILKNHGLLTRSKNLNEAFKKTETIEEVAKLQYLSNL